MVFQNDILAGASGAGAGYTIDQSIRFNDDDGSDLVRTLSAGDEKTWTYSLWAKRGELGTLNYLLEANGGAGGNQRGSIYFDAADKVRVTIGDPSNASNYDYLTDAVFRDTSAWYHMVFVLDTTRSNVYNSTPGTNRIEIYVNGEFQTLSQPFSSLPLNYASGRINAALSHLVNGNVYSGTAANFDGYCAEIHFIDGQGLAPTDFGEYNNDGVWVPKEYTGTYGTNGFYITGEDSADLGADYSGNGNDFTSSGLTSDDQVSDSPTENFATFSPINKSTSITLSDGNLLASASGSGDTFPVMATICPESGKWYAEFEMVEADNVVYVGVGNTSETARIAGAAFANVRVGETAGYTTGVSYRNDNGNKYTGGTGSAYGNTFTTGDIIGIALDADTGSVWFSKNGVFQNSGDPAAGTGAAATGLTGPFCFAMSIYNTDDVRANFGQFAFDYTAPTGFSALSTANLPGPAIEDGSAYFQTTLYTGNGTAIGSGGNAVSQSENSTFQPDFVWIKRRDSAVEHVLTDAVRGVTEELSSNDTGAEETVAEGLTTFSSSGFTVGSDGSYNTNTGTYAAWQWLAANGTASNTDGTITSTVSANTTAGFSISTYTGTGSNATVGHGLGSAPSMVIVKNRTTAGYSWMTYHEEVGATYYATLGSTAAFTTAGAVGIWNNTAPTSSVFSVGTSTQVNGSANNYVAYCFAEVEGFSKFGKYTGNGSTDGPFVWCGFRPAFIMTKRTNSTGNWTIFDNQREGYNVDNDELVANTTAAETTTDYVDILSNGFKLRSSDADVNASGSTYIFMAFAEHPFGGNGVAPVPAR